jgi:phosphatidylglycerol:prolipoprotein diacylglycerol transferase
VIAYFLWVAAGIALALVARRWQGNVTGLDDRERTGILLVAIGGAIAGAYGFELLADLNGWTAPLAPGSSADNMPMGGRTILGGILGGWVAVEIAKRAFGIRRPTGDAFALPLAIALGFGRIGCISAGCCLGRLCAPGMFASVDARGMPHVPVPAIEAAFHFAAAIGLALAVRRGWLAGRRLAAYVTAYAVVRFVLETVRMNPPWIAGLTYYQVLSLALFALAGLTWWSRRTGVGALRRSVRAHDPV